MVEFLYQDDVGTKTKKKIDINASLMIMGKVFEGKGKTVEKAISSLKPENVRGHAVLVLEKGDLKRERILSKSSVDRAFGKVNKLTKEIGLKNITTYFSSDFND